MCILFHVHTHSFLQVPIFLYDARHGFILMFPILVNHYMVHSSLFSLFIFCSSSDTPGSHHLLSISLIILSSIYTCKPVSDLFFHGNCYQLEENAYAPFIFSSALTDITCSKLLRSTAHSIPFSEVLFFTVMYLLYS